MKRKYSPTKQTSKRRRIQKSQQKQTKVQKDIKNLQMQLYFCQREIEDLKTKLAVYEKGQWMEYYIN